MIIRPGCMTSLFVFLFLVGCDSDSHVQAPCGSTGVCVSLPQSVVAFWTGDSVASDAIEGFVGAPHGGASYGAGMVSSSFSFPGGTGYYEVPDSSPLDLSGSLGIVVWVRLLTILPLQPDFGGPGWDDFHFIVEKGEGSYTTRNYGLYFSKTTDELVFSGVNLAGNAYVFNVSMQNAGRVFNDLGWHLVAASWDRDRQEADLTVDNGMPIITNGLNEPVRTNDLPLRIGAANLGQYYLNGQIDELMIFDRPVDASFLAELFARSERGVCRP